MGSDAEDFLRTPILARFLASFRHVRLDLAVSNAATDIVESGYDAGIRLGEVIDRDMIAVPVSGDMRLAVVAGDQTTIARVEGRQALGPRWVSHLLQALAAEMLRDAEFQGLCARAAESCKRARVICEKGRVSRLTRRLPAVYRRSCTFQSLGVDSLVIIGRARERDEDCRFTCSGDLGNRARARATD